jgi:protein involved in polysaccharide export with SLBB domain
MMNGHVSKYWAGIRLLLTLALWLSADLSVPAAEHTNKAVLLDTLQVGDVVRITLAGPPEVTGKPPLDQKIKDDGTISLDYINSIEAAGKTATQLEKDIVAAYVPKYYKRLSVIVMTDNRFFYVKGEVKLGGKFPHVAGMTVTKAIANAGGFNDFAKKTEVSITRQDGKVETVDCKKADKDASADKPVNPGDIINVPRRLF